jgi:hypothetical protein
MGGDTRAWPPPRPGSAEVGAHETPRRAPETVPENVNVSGAVTAPATPFAAREGSWDRRMG